MPLSDLSPFLAWGSAVCLVMAVIWLFRWKAKGASAYLMSGAFVVLSGMFLAMRAQMPMGLIIGLGVVLVVLLGLDIGVRSARREDAKR